KSNILKKNPHKKQLFMLIDSFLQRSQHLGCFCYMITINFGPQEIVSPDPDENVLKQFLSLLNRISDIAFYVLSLEYHKNGKPHIRVFLAIDNLIGNNNR